eukprot:TRINITY_DN54331_c0_g1_i1.p1 TRINITY_DN54331_c0_g1~~TRINITY_DN54331_c0_g1_i1.p1  ORF type:complete len:652 (-),score=161.41 TRINITY_DN54331_c0_g1_i1:23-1978(-)
MALAHECVISSPAAADEFLSPSNWRAIAASPDLCAKAALLLVASSRERGDERGARNAIFLARHASHRGVDPALRAEVERCEQELQIRAPPDSAVLLLKAVGACDVGAVQKLLCARACVDACDANEVHPVVLAAAHPERHAVLKMLLAHKACVAARDSGGRTALQKASFNMDLPSVTSLLVAGADVLAAADNGMTALHAACCSDLGDAATRQRVAKLLLSRRSDVNARMEEGFTPLMQVAQRQQDLPLLQDLLAAGAALRPRLLPALGGSAGEGGNSAAGLDAYCLAALSGEGSGRECMWEEGCRVLRSAMQGGDSDLSSQRAADDLALEWSRLVDSLLAALRLGASVESNERAVIDAAGSAKDCMLRTLVAAALDLHVDSVDLRDATLCANPLLAVHGFLSSRIPPVLTKVFHGEDAPREEEVELLLLLGTLSSLPSGTLIDDAGKPILKVATNYAPESGVLASPLYDHVMGRCVCALQQAFAFAVPSEEALEAIQALASPIVELGAGSGYWAAQLARRGVDVVAYDLAPPTKVENFFFSRQHFDVRRGGPEVLASESPDKALLLVWPFQEELHLKQTFASDPWDAKAVLEFRGEVIVHVGEFPSETRRVVNTSPRFAELLREEFELERTVPMPRFPFNLDEMTIWRRRKR